jgi:hypothetical protein
MSRTTHVYAHSGPDPVLGIRCGARVCDRANHKGFGPRGAVMQLAKALALRADEQQRDADGNRLPAKYTNRAVKDPSRIRARISSGHLSGAEEIVATRKLDPNGEVPREVLAKILADCRPVGEGSRGDAARLPYEQVRDVRAKERRAARQAQGIAAKGSRKRPTVSPHLDPEDLI